MNSYLRCGRTSNFHEESGPGANFNRKVCQSSKEDRWITLFRDGLVHAEMNLLRGSFLESLANSRGHKSVMSSVVLLRLLQGQLDDVPPHLYPVSVGWYRCIPAYSVIRSKIVVENRKFLIKSCECYAIFMSIIIKCHFENLRD